MTDNIHTFAALNDPFVSAHGLDGRLLANLPWIAAIAVGGAPKENGGKCNDSDRSVESGWILHHFKTLNPRCSAGRKSSPDTRSSDRLGSRAAWVIPSHGSRGRVQDYGQY